MLNDFRYAFRVLQKNSSFTMIAVLSLALGIGANTAIFSLINAMLLRDLPVYEPKDLVLLGAGKMQGLTDGLMDQAPQLFSVPFYREAQRSNVFAELAAVESMPQRVYGRFNSGSPEPVKSVVVSGNYFTTLGVPAYLGRTFTRADDVTPGAHPVLVLSHSYWKRRCNGDPSVIGRKLRAGDTVYSVTGVAAPNFFGTSVGESPDAWFPMAMLHQVTPWLDILNDKMAQSAYLIGRLKPGVTAHAAAVRIDAIFHPWMLAAAPADTRPEEKRSFENVHIELSSMARGMSGLRDQFASSLKILMGVVVIVLLIACANIANLLLARAAARQREIAVRLAIGSGRWRLIRQLLAESVLLALMGGAAGVFAAWWGGQALLKMLARGPDEIPLAIAPDLRTLGFTLAVALGTGILFGLAPALRATNVDLNPALKEGKGASGARRGRLGKALVIGQVALSLLLLIGAGLFLRTLRNLAVIDTGFNRDSVLLFHLDTDYSGYTDGDARLPGVYQRIEKRVAAIPGVKSASFSQMNFGPSEWSSSVEPLGETGGAHRIEMSNGNVIDPSFFDVMGINLVMGRVFNDSDSASATKVAVLNETAAKALFPGVSPLGRQFLQNSKPIEVVGVVKNAKYVTVREKPRRMIYFPAAQRIGYYGEFAVRIAGDGVRVTPQIRAAIAEAEPNFPVVTINTMRQEIDRTLSRERLVARLSAFFGLLALILACIGLYGILSYGVARRTGEIGIRMALGASSRAVLNMVFGETAWLLAIGLAIGIPCALALSRIVQSLLYDLKANDAFTIGVAALVMAGFGALAAWFPARRAARVDPITALRYE